MLWSRPARRLPAGDLGRHEKKELVGEFKNGGRELGPRGDPQAVNVHDFVTDLGRANPYGVYDLAADSAWVSVETDHDTASFAVQTIRRW
jgi:hypothetical protein